MSNTLPHSIVGVDANEVYPQAIEAVLLSGQEVPSRVSATKEIHPAVITVLDPTRPVVTSFGRPVNVAFALAEVLWILGGRNDVAMVEFYNSQIAQYSDNGETFNAAYGHRLRYAHGYDQIEDVTRLLTEDPESRQATLTMVFPPYDRHWQPGHQINSDTGTLIGFEDVRRETKDRACNVLAHLMIRDGELDWMQIVRSNDSLWGLPYNFIQWMSIQQFIAAALGVSVGKYVHIADSLHIYDYHYAEAASIKGFDLYTHLVPSRASQHLPLEQSMATRDAVEYMLAWEQNLRTMDNPSRLIPVPDQFDGTYWQSFYELFTAYRMYKDGRHEQAAMLLSEMDDQVLAMAQARHFYYWNWYKHDDWPHFASIMLVDKDMTLMGWMTASHNIQPATV